MFNFNFNFKICILHFIYLVHKEILLIKMTELNGALDCCLIEIVKDAHPYTSKHTILRRLLNRCAEILDIDLNLHNNNKRFMYIHPDNMFKIDTKWQSLKQRGLKILHEEENVYKSIKNSDLVHVYDLQKFINILIQKTGTDFLILLLAIDGFQGLNPKNYLDNLRIADEGSTHIHVIRDIYKHFNGLPVTLMYLMLLKIYIRFAKDDEMQQLMINVINDLENKSCKIEKKLFDMDRMINTYIYNVDELEAIAMLKMAQLKILKKKLKEKDKSKI